MEKQFKGATQIGGKDGRKRVTGRETMMTRREGVREEG